MVKVLTNHMSGLRPFAVILITNLRTDMRNFDCRYSTRNVRNNAMSFFRALHD